MTKLHVSTTINGEPAEYLCEPYDTMLDALRGPLGLTGSKEGCASGDCGASASCWNDRLVCSCLMLSAEAEGHELRTIEGMAHGDKLHPLQQSFWKWRRCSVASARRMLVASDALLQKNPRPSEEEVRFWLAGNLCGAPVTTRSCARFWKPPLTCGSKESRSPGNERHHNNKWIGQRTIRPDGADKVTDARPLPPTHHAGMIWGKVKRSPHPHARIKSIDTSKAEALPGVKAVVTSRRIVDFPIDKVGDARHPGHALMCRNVMAREKALFPATRSRPSQQPRGDRGKGLRIDRSYLRGAAVSVEIDDAIKPDAPILHDFMKFEASRPTSAAGSRSRRVTSRKISPRPKSSSSAASPPARCIRGYIEPHACLISVGADNKTTIWSSSQGQSWCAP